MASSQPNTQAQPTQMGQGTPKAQPAQMQAQVPPAKPLFTDLASI